MINRDDLKELYLMIEALNDFFHQPDNYENAVDVKNFAEKIYPDLHRMYYETVWQMLPDDLKEEISNT